MKSPKEPSKGGKWILNTDVVKMTPYYRTSDETQNFLFRYQDYGHGYFRFCSKRRKTPNTWPPYTCNNENCGGRELQQSMGKWEVQHDYLSWSESSAGTYAKSSLSTAQVYELMLQSRAEVASKSMRDYDALTEIFEFKEMAREYRESSKLVRERFGKFLSDHPKSDLKVAAKLTSKQLVNHAERGLRRIGKAWLAYRYAIMPLVYSFRDIEKALTRWEQTTDRVTKRVKPTENTAGNPWTHLPHVVSEEEGEVRITSTVGCKYTSNNMALAGKLGFNPFSTAWELIPYSFVMDWFINIGESINTVFGKDLSSSVGACTAIKVSKITTYTAVYPRDYEVYHGWATDGYPLSYCWPEPLPYQQSYHLADVSGVLRVVTQNHYSRTLFKRGGAVRLQVNPSLTWRRDADLAALSLKLFKNTGDSVLGLNLGRLDLHLGNLARSERGSVINLGGLHRPR